jgi:hypothetical protein
MQVRLVAQQAAQDADTTPTLPVVALTSSDAVNEGDDVIVNKRGTPWFGSAATVVRSSRNQVRACSLRAYFACKRGAYAAQISGRGGLESAFDVQGFASRDQTRVVFPLGLLCQTPQSNAFFFFRCARARFFAVSTR